MTEEVQKSAQVVRLWSPNRSDHVVKDLGPNGGKPRRRGPAQRLRA